MIISPTRDPVRTRLEAQDCGESLAHKGFGCYGWSRAAATTGHKHYLLVASLESTLLHAGKSQMTVLVGVAIPTVIKNLCLLRGGSP